MSDFMEWFVPRAVVVALLIAFVFLCYRVSRWQFEECLRVGHSRAYCTYNNLLGAHSE